MDEVAGVRLFERLADLAQDGDDTCLGLRPALADERLQAEARRAVP